MLRLLFVQITDENAVQYTYSETVIGHCGSCDVLFEWILDRKMKIIQLTRIIYRAFSVWVFLHLFLCLCSRISPQVLILVCCP